MKLSFSDLFPVGMKESAIKLMCFGSILLSAIISTVMFFSSYYHSYLSLFLALENGKVLKENAVMPEYGVLREDIFFAFHIFVVCLAGFAIYNFAYHYIGSKSIYTMRRLKNPVELAVRCLAIPVIFAFISFISVMILNFLYFTVYIKFTPSECLLPSAQMMWRF